MKFNEQATSVLGATPAEYTVGTNAAMPVANSLIDNAAGIFASRITLEMRQELVSNIVVAAIKAVDAYRANVAKQKKALPLV